MSRLHLVWYVQFVALRLRPQHGVQTRGVKRHFPFEIILSVVDCGGGCRRKDGEGRGGRGMRTDKVKNAGQTDGVDLNEGA